MSFSWFIVQANTNCEKMVKRTLEDRIKQFGAEEHFGDILVPTQDVIEMKNGQKKKIERKLFPNYVFIQIATTDGLINSEAWHVVRETPKVTGFVGGTQEKPLPMSAKEAEKMIGYVQVAAETPVARSEFQKGQNVRIVDGPFADFNGVVEESDAVHGKVKVSVLVFGRATPVDFQTSQVEVVA